MSEDSAATRRVESHGSEPTVFTGRVSATARWLTTLGDSEVATLLRRRPDVVAEPRPRDLGDLAARLDDPYSVGQVLRTATLPCLQVAEALQALGGRARRDDMAALLEGADGDTGGAGAQALDDAVGWLVEVGAVLPADGWLEASPALGQCFTEPLGLGAPLTELLVGQTVQTLQRMLSALGRPRAGAKATLLSALTGHLTDPERVREVVAEAPPAVAASLSRRAGGSEASSDDAILTRYDPAAHRQEQEAVRWGLERGLLVGSEWSYDWRMPAEVALALRGPGYRAPFTPAAPQVRTHDVAVEDVARESAAAATSFAAHSVSVLDHVARSGVPTLKSGGVGARELTRLARATGSTDEEVRLVLVLASACGLLTETDRAVVTGAGLEAWRDGEPADRYVGFLEVWWELGGHATEARDRDGKVVPVLRTPLDCPACAAARVALLTTLAGLVPAAATEVLAVGPAALWARPLVHPSITQDAVPFQTTWREAELLGVVSRGTLSELGRRLVAGDRDGIASLAGDVLPGTSDEAVFGADMTVMVVGAPSARVSALLDRCADRESRGGAVVWRVTPGSVRRALDEGTTGDELEGDLQVVARGDLPQPLRYLVRDVARRHGSVRVRAIACCLRSDEEALLAEIAVDRRLERLRLQVLAPTVLASDVDAKEVVQALRGAGYLPMPEDRTGLVAVTSGGSRAPGDAAAAGRPPRGARRSPPRTRPVDVAAVAAELVSAGLPDRPPATSGTEVAVTALAPRLPAAQRRLLAHAIDHGTDVVIEYVASTGGRTERRVGELVLLGGGIQAWCDLRQDERYFTVSRILCVRPAA